MQTFKWGSTRRTRLVVTAPSKPASKTSWEAFSQPNEWTYSRKVTARREHDLSDECWPLSAGGGGRQWLGWGSFLSFDGSNQHRNAVRGCAIPSNRTPDGSDGFEPSHYHWATAFLLTCSLPSAHDVQFCQVRTNYMQFFRISWYKQYLDMTNTYVWYLNITQNLDPVEELKHRFEIRIPKFVLIICCLSNDIFCCPLE